MFAINRRENSVKTTFLVEVAAKDPDMDVNANTALHELRGFGLAEIAGVRSVRLYAIHGPFVPRDIDHIASELLADPVLEMFSVNQPVFPCCGNSCHTIEIAKRSGVMDPLEASTLKGISHLGYQADWIRSGRRYIFNGSVSKSSLYTAVTNVLANLAIEVVAIDSCIRLDKVESEPAFQDRHEIRLDGLDDAGLEEISRLGQLSLSIEEMRVIQAYFAGLARNPTDVELETIAQTWSEHCSHKTFRGRISYRENGGTPETIDNLLKNTVFKVTRDLARPWCWSVFEDNSGVMEFNGEYGLAFKVETHNHPSAIEPYGGAGTGIGGVIRDTLGTGLGGKPILSTGVFCLGPLDLPRADIPAGALHPLRVLKGAAAGVRDYGNRMGIPTVNGAICIDRRFIGNPLVFCGNLALIPKAVAARRRPKPGDIALVVGGRTGRDSIHGATFSSVELDKNSETMSSGSVQLGHPIEEKKMTDFLLRARDAGLYSCITDCGAGGLSSALGEMGAECGVSVELEKAPLKYDGLTYCEVWISEAQERMVIAADRSNLMALQALAKEEEVEITPIASFTDDRQLTLYWHKQQVARLDMEFLHHGIPSPWRDAEWTAPVHPEPALPADEDFNHTLKRLLASWDVCSKEWVIRQYDHEAQGGAVVKPLVGALSDGPGDAAVVTPILGDFRAAAVACGIKPAYSDIDPYWMAAMAIDEALRNLVAVGAPIDRAVLLDNFCWGNCNKPDRLGSLVRAAKACHDIALGYGTPFISGKDSLNNEFAVDGGTMSVPGTLLVSALSVMPDCRKAVTMDAKKPGNLVYLVGITRNELGASHYHALHGAVGNSVPKVDTVMGLKVFRAVNQTSESGLAASCHDCSEGGFAVAAAEMAFAGGFGMEIDLEAMPVAGEVPTAARLFSESASRLVLETDPEDAAKLEEVLSGAGVPFALLGKVTDVPRLVIMLAGHILIDSDINELKSVWRDALPAIL